MEDLYKIVPGPTPSCNRHRRQVRLRAATPSSRRSSACSTNASTVTILRPLISPNNTINVNPGNNSLVITDYADNLRRLARIIAALDLPTPPTWR